MRVRAACRRLALSHLILSPSNPVTSAPSGASPAPYTGSVRRRLPSQVSLWLPALLLLALGAYLWPEIQPPPEPATITSPATPAAPPQLPGALPAATQAIFEKSRPATVRVETLNAPQGTGGTVTGGIGTGFFISAGGQLLTAYHVVSSGQLFQVTTLSGQSYPAQVTAFDAARDVALLKVSRGGPFPYLKLVTRAPRIGETVLAIGNSHGDFLQPRRGTLLDMNVAAQRADFPQGTLEMDASLAPGDSGGPIIDGNGQALGVVSYIHERMNGTTASSYAVPVVAGNDLMTALLGGVKHDLPVVGLVLDPTHSGQTDPPGAVVLRVARGSPGERAGLRGCQQDSQGQLVGLGDVITSVDGVATPDANTFIRTVQRLNIGQQVRVEYLRAGQRQQTTLTLAARRSVKDLSESSASATCISR